MHATIIMRGAGASPVPVIARPAAKECEQAPGEARSACYEINRVARMSAP